MEATSWSHPIPAQHTGVQTSPAWGRCPLLVQICDGQEDLRTSYFDDFERQFQGEFNRCKQFLSHFTGKI